MCSLGYLLVSANLCAQKVLPFLPDAKLGRNDSAIIVVSPIVSLMMDQANNLKSKGVDAAIMSISTWVRAAIHS